MRVALALTISAFVVSCQGSSGTSTTAPPSTATSGADSGSASELNIEVAPLTLTPTFSPSIHDYYVRCASGTNPLTITATAGSSGTVALLRPSATAPAASQTTDLNVVEGQAVVVSAASGSSSSEYWIRCLPHDFPRLGMTAHPGAGAVVPGYYLVGAIFFASGESGYAMVLDGNGTPVWYGLTSTSGGAKDVDLLQPNTLSYVPIAGYTFGTYEGEFEEHSLDPVGVSYVTSVGLPVDTHEIRRLPNGDYLLFASPIVTGVNLVGLSNYGPSEDIVNTVLQEVTPAGDVTWQWSAIDHFDIVKETTFPQTQGATNLAGQNVTVIDPFHCNSIDWDSDGNLLVSARHMDAVFLISKATGKVLWKLGGSHYNKDGAALVTVTGDPQGGFFRQHDARFLPDGTISLFDDETSKPGPARALVVSYDVSAGTASIVWQYKGKASVSAMGSFTLLPDGSRVIGWGTQDGNPTFTEVDANGNDLLDFSFTDGDSSYRALKVPTSAIDIETLRQAVGGGGEQVATTDGGGAGQSLPQDADSGAPAVAACHTVSGSNSTQLCSYESSDAPGFSCASIPGSTAGSCPSAGLYGCCLQTSMADGGQAITANCYYDASTGEPAMSQCSFAAYDGMPYRWQTMPP